MSRARAWYDGPSSVLSVRTHEPVREALTAGSRAVLEVDEWWPVVRMTANAGITASLESKRTAAAAEDTGHSGHGRDEGGPPPHQVQPLPSTYRRPLVCVADSVQILDFRLDLFKNSEKDFG